MADYITPPLTTEPDDLSAEAFAYLEDRIPGWLPAPGNLETWLIESLAQLAGELMDVASAVPAEIFAYFGASLLGLPPHVATPAMSTTTWTASDDLGYTIQAGTLIGIPATGDELVGFAVQEDVVIAPGATIVAGVTVVAEDAGADANGLTGDPELIDALDYIASVTLDAPTAGGTDGEEVDDYLNRLRELLTLLSPRPILPNDFAVLAKQHAAVGRATAIDLFQAGTELDPATGADMVIPPASVTPVERCVTVVVVGEDGEPIGKPARQEIADDLDARREVNFLVYVIDPAYVTVDVAFSITVYEGYDAQAVVAQAESDVADYLSPANFGIPPFGDQLVWVADTKVRWLEVAEVINRTEGVWYIATLTINGGTADIDLPDPAGLSRAGTVDGQVVAPS
jgi:baseplate J-like protein